MSWGISENATPKEKFWADINDTLKGFNSVGKIDYVVYCEMYDELRNVFDLHFKTSNSTNTKTNKDLTENQK